MNLIFPILAVILVACNSIEKPETTADLPPAKDSAESKSDFFPVRDYILGDIAAIDSMPVAIRWYRSSALKKDSGYLERAEFHKLSAEFLAPELGDSTFKKEFTETSFLDKSNNSSTFFYSTANNNLALRRVDVVTAPGSVYDKIKSIYLEKRYEKKDSSITKKLYWKPGRNFQIITQSSKNQADPETELLKVVWDDRD